MGWHRAIVVSGLVVLAGCPDKNSPERQVRNVVATFRGFADRMCACKDKACADRVQNEMSTWSTEMARTMKVEKAKPDEALMKEMTELGTRYGECMTKVMSAPDVAPPRNDVPPTSSSQSADTLLRTARDWARATQPAHFISVVELDYVDASGALDSEHGRVSITFGRARLAADDARRKIGAPVPNTAPSDCFRLTWAPPLGWDRMVDRCNEAFDVTSHCTTAQVWKKAIDKHAPAAALAKIEMRSTPAGVSWRFAIEDEPRGIHIEESFADDCPFSVEK